MTEWFAQAGVVAVALAVVFAPGLVVARALGLRGLASGAFAPVAATAILLAVAIGFGALGIPWNAVTAVTGIIVVAAAVSFLARAVGVRRSAIRVEGSRWWIPAGLVSGAVLISVRLVAYIGSPGAVSQSNDAPFHLGAVRAILEHARATPFGLGGLVDPEAIGAFYPGAWHAVISLVVALTGSDIPVATNAVTLVVGAAVWPVGVAWLTQAATGSRLAAAATAAMAGALVAFPVLLVQYGILYSYLFAVALLPAAVAVVVHLARGGAPGGAGWWCALTAAIGLAALALATAQPAALLTWGMMLGAFGTATIVSRWPGASGRRRWAALAIAVLGWAGLALAWRQMSQLVTADYWGAVRTPARAVIDVVSSGYAGTTSAWAVSVLGFVGGLLALRRWSTAWLSAAWLGLAALALVASAVDTAWVRLPLVGPWYGDTYRLAAVLPVLTLPLAGLGVVGVVRFVATRTRPAAGAEQRLGTAALVAVVAVSAVVVAAHPLVQRVHVANDRVEDRSRFVIADDTWLSIDERALVERLPQHVSAGERVIGNPGTGAAFGYALSGVDVFPAKWQVPRSPAYAVLAAGLRDVGTDPAVCDAVEALDVSYALDFGPGDGGTGRVAMPGMTGLGDAQGFELVDRQGTATLWRITGCAR